MTSVIRAITLAANVGRFCWRHKRLTLAAVATLLILGPLMTGSGGQVFFLNLVSLGIAALVVRRIVRAGKGKQAGCRCGCHRQRTNIQQQGGTP